MENKNQEQLFNFKEMMNEQHESLFEPIKKIEESKNEPSLKPTFVKKIDCIKDLSECGSNCECVKEKEVELNTLKEPEEIKQAELVKDVKTALEKPKKNVWHYLNPLSWRLPKFTK
jgi:hypothetical protein